MMNTYRWAPLLALTLMGCDVTSSTGTGTSFCLGFCAGRYTPPPASPPILTITGQLSAGGEELYLAGLEAHVVLVAAEDSTTILGEALSRGRKRYVFEYYGTAAAAPPEVCSGLIIVMRNDGRPTEPMPALTEPQTSCSGPQSGPDFDLDPSAPPVTFWGHVGGASEGRVEIFGDDADVPLHTTLFKEGWWIPPDPNFNPASYTTSLGFAPNDDIPDGTCQELTIRAVATDGRTSNLRPLRPASGAPCEGWVLIHPPLFIP